MSPSPARPHRPGHAHRVRRIGRVRRIRPIGHIRRSVLVAVLPALLVAAACGGGRADRVPPGLTFAGSAAQLRPILDRLEGLTGSPAARDAARAQQAIAGCTSVFARCGDETDPGGSKAASGSTKPTASAGCDLVGALRCADDGAPEWVETLRGDAGWVFAGSTEPGRWLVVRGTTAENGSVSLDAEAYPAGVEGPISLVLPAEEPAGPPHLSSAESLIHVRLRPDGGLNLSRFIEGGDWGARLYRLQSKLFEGTALAGVWELAVYAPAPEERIPPMALALDIRDRDLAVQVMEKFLDDLMATWPARRNDYQLGVWTGACLSNVRVMPDLAPCYVATDDTLVIGWNAESVRDALAGAPGTDDASGSSARSAGLSAPPAAPSGDATPGPADGSEARVFFSRLPPVDAMLAQVSGTTPLPPSFYPWSRLDLRGRRGDDSYLFHAELVAP